MYVPFRYQLAGRLALAPFVFAGLALALPVWGTMKIASKIGRAVARRQAAEPPTPEARVRLIKSRQQMLIEVPPGIKRDRLLALYQQVIPAWHEFQLTHSKEAARTYTELADQITWLLSWQPVECANCGAPDQVAGKPCNFCRQRVAV